MSKAKSRSLLLKIVSVLFIVYGLYFVVASVLSLVGGNIVIPGMNYLAAGAGWIGALLEFVAGYFGLRRRNRTLCTVLGIIILVLSVVTLCSTVNGSSSVWTIVSGVIPVILPLLYLYGVRKS